MDSLHVKRTGERCHNRVLWHCRIRIIRKISSSIILNHPREATGVIKKLVGDGECGRRGEEEKAYDEAAVADVGEDFFEDRVVIVKFAGYEAWVCDEDGAVVGLGEVDEGFVCVVDLVEVSSFG